MRKTKEPTSEQKTPIPIPLPFLDLKAQFHGIRKEIMEAVTRVLESQQFILGPEVEAFEREMAVYTDCQHAIACASGTDALILSLLALGVAPGDEVITTPFTFVASAGAIVTLGAKPVFADIDLDTFNISPQAVGNAMTPRTRAILPVHLFGLSAEMDAIQRIAAQRGIPVIEDAAQAIGARYKDRTVGSIGAVGCFSFFPSKNLGGAGDGGIITTNDAALAGRLRLLRVHGSRVRYEYEIPGMNSRLDALQAAVLRVKLRHLDVWTDARKRNAQRYRQLFPEYGVQSTVELPVVPRGFGHVFNQYTIRSKHRDALREHLSIPRYPQRNLLSEAAASAKGVCIPRP